MPLFSPSNDSELDLIMDIGNAVVRGSLVLYKSGSAPHVTFTYSANIPWKAHTDTSYIIKTTMKAVTETLDAARRSAHIQNSEAGEIPKKIRAVHFVLSSPWIISEAKFLQKNFQKSIPITKAQVTKMISDERTSLTPENITNIRIIEQKISDVRLNGYSVSDWQGKNSNSLEVAYVESVAGTKMLDHFRDLASQAFRKSAIYFHSSLLLQVIGMKSVAPTLSDYGLLSIQGESTDIVTVADYNFRFVGSYTCGVRTLVRRIATNTDTDYQSADSLMALYVGGHLDLDHNRDSLAFLTNVLTDWSRELDTIVTNQSKDHKVPNSLILSAFAHDDFFLKSLTKQYPKSHILSISIDDILPHVSFGNHSQRRRLTGLYALAIHNMS